MKRQGHGRCNNFAGAKNNKTKGEMRMKKKALILAVTLSLSVMQDLPMNMNLTVKLERVSKG